MTDTRQLIARLLTWTLLLLVVHTIVVYSWSIADPVAASQWGSNRIRTERVLYDLRPSDCVLVGSSLSANIDFTRDTPASDLPRVLNMAYAGGSPLTGMQVVAAADTLPACLLVESNLAYKPADSETVRSAYHPLWYPLKKQIRNLRHENQPLNLLLSYIKTLTTSSRQTAGTVVVEPHVNQTSSTLPGTLPGQSPAIGTTNETPPVIHNPMAEQRVKSMNLTAESYLQQGTQAMASLASELEARGTRVIFFEMPGEVLVRQSDYYKRLHAHFERVFNDIATSTASTFMVHRIDIGPVRTNDGIHLTASYLQKIPAQIYSLIRNG